MSDIADNADRVIEQHLACALATLRPIPLKCERCPEPSLFIAGRPARFCADCFEDFRAGL